MWPLMELYVGLTDVYIRYKILIYEYIINIKLIF